MAKIQNNLKIKDRKIKRIHSLLVFIPGSRACSECSSECGCVDHLDDEGPNQVNFLATTNEIVGPSSPKAGDNQKNTAVVGPAPQSNDLTMQLHRVLGSLESEIEHRKQNKTTTGPIDGDRSNTSNAVDAGEVDLESNFLGEAREVRHTLLLLLSLLLLFITTDFLTLKSSFYNYFFHANELLKNFLIVF